MDPEFYLDNAATTALYPEVLEACRPLLAEDFGNPSSLHPLGMAARRRVKQARQTMARLFGVPPEGITFTGGGTESCNLALKGAFATPAQRSQALLVSEIEHPAVLESAEWLARFDVPVRKIPVTAGGTVDLARLEQMLHESVRMVSVMAVNNETGVMQPLAEIGRLLRRLAPQALFHVDAVQAFTKVPLNFREAGVHLVSISGHKVHGPKGTGALIRLRPVALAPLIHGGGQEAGLRSGTENPFGIAALAMAAERSMKLHAAQRDMRAAYHRAWLEELAGHERVRVFRGEAAGPFVITFAVPPVPGEVTLHHLEQEGLCVSTGSACHTGDAKPSHVLLASGWTPELALSAVRLSFSVHNTVDGLPRVLPAFRRAMARVAAL